MNFRAILNVLRWDNLTKKEEPLSERAQSLFKGQLQSSTILASFCLLWGLNYDMKWRIQLFFLDFNDWIIRKIKKIKIHKNSLKNESWRLKLLNVMHFNTWVAVAAIAERHAISTTTFSSFYAWRKRWLVRIRLFFTQNQNPLVAISSDL